MSKKAKKNLKEFGQIWTQKAKFGPKRPNHYMRLRGGNEVFSYGKQIPNSMMNSYSGWQTIKRIILPAFLGIYSYAT